MGDVEIGPGSETEQVVVRETIFVRLKSVQREERGPAHFFTECCSIICNTIGCTLALIIVLVVPILMIYYGVVHYNQCRAQKPLPLYLVVAGSSGVFKIILFVSKNLCKKFFLIVVIESPATLFVYSAFMFVWFILGNVWVFEIFWPNLDDPKAFNYCCKQVYLLALTVIVGSHVFFFVGICCMVAAYVTSQNKVRSEAPPIPSSVQIQEIRRERT